MSSHLGALKPNVRRSATGWAVCAIAFAIYIPSLFSEFIRDDRWQIVENPQIQSWDYLPRLFSTHLWSQAGNERAIHFYRPLFSTWMLVVNTIGGLAPAWWHFSSILLQAVTTFAVYKLCDNLLRNRVPALFAALLFAVQPIHVDAVSWVSASNEILFTLLALGAIIVLLAPDGSVPLTRSRLAASAALYAAALLTKETAVALSPVLLLIVLLRAGQRGKVVRAAYWYGLVTLGYFAIRWLALGRIGTEESKHSWREVLLSSPSVLAFYLKKLVIPLHLRRVAHISEGECMLGAPCLAVFETWGFLQTLLSSGFPARKRRVLADFFILEHSNFPVPFDGRTLECPGRVRKSPTSRKPREVGHSSAW